MYWAAFAAVAVLLLLNTSRYTAPVGSVFGGSTFLHLSIIMSMVKGYLPWQDPHYLGEYAYYPWLQHALIAALQRLTGASPVTLFNTWVLPQTLSMLAGYYLLGRELRDERLGAVMGVLALLPRSTLRVELLPWPLYTSYALVPFYLLLLLRAGKLRYRIAAGVVLGMSLMLHLFTFIMLATFTLLYLLSSKRSGRAGVILGVALLAASPYWLPLLLTYHGATQNPTQEMVYKLYAFRSAYPFTSSPDNPLMVAQDMVLNRVVSRVEGGESLGDLNNVLLFSLALLGALTASLRRRERVLVCSFIAAAVLLRLHGYLPLPTRFQPIRFTDFIEHGMLMLAAFGVYQHRRSRELLLLTLLLSLGTAAANVALNPNSAAGVKSEFGVKGEEHLLEPEHGRYAFITAAANALEDAEQRYGEGVVLAHPVTALYLAGLTGYKFVALPPGFSNVFVNVSRRVEDAKGFLRCSASTEVLARYGVKYVVADPLIASPCLDTKPELRLIYRQEGVNYPAPWGEHTGNLSIYVVERYTVARGGVPLTYYGGELGWQLAYHNVALVARENFYRYGETGDVGYLREALNLTDFLISRAEPLDGGVIWRNPFPWRSYGLEAGWAGSLMQAGIIKTLMLAYLYTGNRSYLRYGDLALRAFEVDAGRGGLRVSREGWVWYPEYAKQEPPYVLNGFITTLLWLREYWQNTNSTLALRLYTAGEESLRHFLPGYDAGGGWSYYDALGNPAAPEYHRLHLQLLLQMYRVTGNETYLTWYRRWGGDS